MPVESDPLTDFLALVPYADRQRTASAIVKLRKDLHEQIDHMAPFTRPAAIIRSLKKIFTHTPISLRRSLKEKIFIALTKSLESSEVLAIFAILLSIIEVCSFRNADRCDLEKDDILTSLSSLNPIIDSISQTIISRHSNLLSCRAWVVAMLVYTYRQCLIWCSHQDCLDLHEKNLDELIPMDAAFYSSPSVPKLLRIALNCQRNNSSPPATKENYSLIELLMLSAFSDNTSSLIMEHSEVNFLENELDTLCTALKATAVPKVVPSPRSLPSLEELQASFDLLDPSKVRDNLQLIEFLILDNVPLLGDFKQSCKMMIQNAPAVMISVLRKMDAASEISDDLKSLYSQLFCGFLRVWIHALEKRLIFEDMPQSYLYLCAFVNIRFQDMLLKDFVQAVGVISHFLTTYARIFRANILASPHWFLQMLCDCVIGIIDRLSSATDEEELATLEYAVCPCIASISRTWASLRAEEPDSRPELSRAVKGLLDTIAVNIAAATVAQTTGKKRKWDDEKSAANNREYSALRPRVRQMLNQGLVFPILDVIDPWALQQSRIGLKPAAACEVLKALISAHEKRKRLAVGEEEADAVISRTHVSAPVAVTGLSGERLKAKAAAKRQKRIREQKVL
ncbi:hypothetical protein Aperf_G00000002668 [Anoplocephala perfoliata]